MKQVLTGVKAIVNESVKVELKDGAIYENKVSFTDGESTIFGVAWTKDSCEKGDLLNVYIVPVWKSGRYTGAFKLRFSK